MIRKANVEGVADPTTLRRLALLYLRNKAWAAAEDPNELADILSHLDTPANRLLLTKILYNLGRDEPPTPFNGDETDA